MDMHSYSAPRQAFRHALQRARSLQVSAVALLFPILLAGCAKPASRTLHTARSVDLSRYAGHWHEIARLPNWFQRNDSRATADYSLEPSGAVHVLNTEYRPNGSTKKATGSATIVPGSAGSRLKVKFDGLASFARVAPDGNYWIIALAPDYSVALVGTPDRKFLWLLARNADLAPSKQQGYLAVAHREGFDTEKVLIHHWPR